MEVRLVTHLSLPTPVAIFTYIFIFINGFVVTNLAQAESQSVDAAEKQNLIGKFENQLAEKLFEDAFDISLSRNPERQTRLGIHENDHKWTNISYDYRQETLELLNTHWAKLKSSINYEVLNIRNKLSYRLLEYNNKQANEGSKYWYHRYPLTQMRGLHTSMPTFLINYHPAQSTSDMETYIARLRGVEQQINQVIQILIDQEKKGIMPPAFVFPYVIDDCLNLISGRPFDDSTDDSPWLEDFKSKVSKLGLVSKEEDRLLNEAEKALKKSVEPSYKKLISYLSAAQKRTDKRDGAWKHPQGASFYKYRLQRITTTGLSADEIHQLGLAEVSRIHEEMLEIMRQVKFKGKLRQFFEHLRTSPEFYLPNDAEGRQKYLDLATGYLGNMQAHLKSMFRTLPVSDLIVKAVEPFREKSAGKAFYSRPSPDGSRPGVFYVNLANTAAMPTYELEALAYHEGIPGHHLQLSISIMLEGVPRFRKFGSYTAYTEGWGLYTEYLAKDAGFYRDPYSDFGRLAMELWRAGRLVVDTGIHAKRWSREQAIKYLEDNTPNPREQIVKGIERYIVMPGQATAYKIGMNKLLELRTLAQQQLGKSFDIRDFHEEVLINGPLPLWLLEENITRWITTSKGSAEG